MINTLMSSVRAFAPTNFIGAPRVVYAPEDGTGTETGDMSTEDAAKAYAASTAEEPDEGQPDATDADDADDELPEDESEGEDEEGDPADEGQAEDDDEDEPGDRGRFVSPSGKVTLPDGTVATVADLIQGNLRDRDYRQKTMTLAEERKSFEAQSSAHKQEMEQITQQRAQMVELLKSIVPEPPNPDMLGTDPMGYMTQKASHDAWVAHLQNLEAQQQQADTARQAKDADEKKQAIDREWASLVEKAPEFKDGAKLDRFVSDLGKFGATYGFSAAEIRERLPMDHRMSLVMRDAIRWQKLQASKAKAKTPEPTNRPPVQKGGQRLDPARAKARAGTAAMERLKKTGSVEDAARAYLASKG